MKFRIGFIIIVAILIHYCTAVIDYDKKLFDYLMTNYSAYTLPQTGTVPSRPTVQIQLEIYGIRQVDLMAGTVSFKCAFRQWWNDTRTMWNPADYGGIKYIWLPTDPNTYDITSWISDMSVRQDAGQQPFTDLKYTNVRIRSDGQNYYSMFGDVTVIAQFELSKYPYDVQEIHMTFGSWLYVDDRVHVEAYNPAFIVQSNANTTWKIDNIEWEFVSYRVDTIFQKAASGNYYRYDYVVQIQRNGGTILVAVLIPGSMITFLGLLYILLPIGEGDRTGYLSCVLLTEIMFLVMITNFVPLSKQVPLLGWLFLSYTCLLVLITLCVLAMEKIYHVFVKQSEDYSKDMIRERKFMMQKDQMNQQHSSQKTMEVSYLSAKSTARRNRYLSEDQSDRKIIDGNSQVDNTFEDLNINEKKDQLQVDTYKEELRKLRHRILRVQKTVRRIDFGVFVMGMLLFILITCLFLLNIF